MIYSINTWRYFEIILIFIYSSKPFDKILIIILQQFHYLQKTDKLALL